MLVERGSNTGEAALCLAAVKHEGQRTADDCVRLTPCVKRFNQRQTPSAGMHCCQPTPCPLRLAGSESGAGGGLGSSATGAVVGTCGLPPAAAAPKKNTSRSPNSTRPQQTSQHCCVTSATATAAVTAAAASSVALTAADCLPIGEDSQATLSLCCEGLSTAAHALGIRVDEHKLRPAAV